METHQVIMVAGASSGLGRLTAESLAGRGHRVFATMRDVNGSNAAASGELSAVDDVDLEVVELDVTSEASVNAAVTTVIDRAGRIDVVDPFTADGVTALSAASQQVQERVFGFSGMSDLLKIGAGSWA